MARLARVVVPGLPHLVTQRGNGGGKVFFSDDDCALYKKLLTDNCRAAKVRVLAYVLMPTHVHLILIPKDEDGLRKALAATHRGYAGIINARRKKTGHFWQGRFGCVALDNAYAAVALRYVLMNPVRARLVAKPEAWRWSSATSLLKRKSDGVTEFADVRSQFGDIKQLLGETPEIEIQEMMLRRAESIGRPLGTLAFLEKLERKLGRSLKPAKRGPKAKRAVKKAKKK
jgi:putative transposase